MVEKEAEVQDSSITERIRYSKKYQDFSYRGTENKSSKDIIT